jgi:histidine triad (HIT) family protein
MADCIFCKIANGELNAHKYYEDEDVVAFADVAPQGPVHVLVIPRRHITSATALTREDQALAGRLIIVAQELAQELGVAETGYRLVLNAGPDGGQLVPHLHVHLLGGRPLAPELG